MVDDSDILGEIEDAIDPDGTSDTDDFEISNEQNSVRLELIAYDGDFYADSIQSDLEDGRREIVFFSIENLSDEVIDVWNDEWQVVGQDGFVYDYVQKPYREIHESEYPPHYPTKREVQLSPDTKTRYLLISAVLPKSVKIRKIEYRFNTSFSLELPDNLLDLVGNPPI